MRKRKRKKSNMKDVFTDIYKNNKWGSTESFSGTGSTLNETENIRTFLESLIRNYQIKSILDAPCGDFNWFKEINLKELNVVSYTGVDIVDELIMKNNERYANDTRSFRVANITEDPLPQADLIICRDCLQHLPMAKVLSALINFKRSGSKYLLASTAPIAKNDQDIPAGSGRLLNLELPPFHFPKPLAMIDDYNQMDPWKKIAMWPIESLPLNENE
ncbi:class I SAM-dependent methyltransferase [Bacillus sp. Marseille-P3661]|uniref:class I SAM-dependent methyltransferase n=1 Tax=Bacillus sp. Marseille-P3661 TaxID=1936234 RepID=UPI00115979DF|nr:class I SAM-dependent methyltransferase [Bacillus sp. Marseille-P3661]